jgi:hypothetical protein
MVAFSLVIAYWSQRPVNWDFMEIRASKPDQLRIKVRKKAALK